MQSVSSLLATFCRIYNILFLSQVYIFCASCVLMLLSASRWPGRDIKNNAWVNVNNNFFGHSWCDLPMKIIGKSHYKRPKKLLFVVTNVLLYLLHAILCPEYTIWLKQSTIAHFAIVAKHGLFWLSIATSLRLICDVNARYCHCVIFINCSCTRKLAQRRTSQVNNNHEYQFLNFRYSRLSTCKNMRLYVRRIWICLIWILNENMLMESASCLLKSF